MTDEQFIRALEIEDEWEAGKKPINEAELLREYPECQDVIVPALQEWEQKRSETYVGVARLLRKAEKELTDANLSWFFTTFVNYSMEKRIEEIDGHIRRLKRLMPRIEIEGEVTDMHVETARQYPIDQLCDVKMRRTGRNMVGRCPFHDEKTASFQVYTGTNTFYCFGCHAGGDSIDYLMKSQGIDFISAVKQLNNNL